ncbi:MAG TPA: flagellar basal-body MS-ring/collar protein FliF [bacterium]|nr:flagellar basal-body MS-ring/collar protein FliF [bacterium]HPP00482.1 flagellar basal-body MS-ring/collar protein FliF [bacterium]
MQEFVQQLRDQLTRIWETLSLQQKVIFVSAPVLLLLFMAVAVYWASRPQLVTLVTMDDRSQLAAIADYLSQQGVRYEIPNERTILVDKNQRARLLMQLAKEDLISGRTGPGWEIFDQTTLGMTDRMFDAQFKRALENELASTIVQGSNNIASADVHLNIPKDRLFRADSSPPTASVKVVSRGILSKEQVQGIQNLVAMAVEKLEPKRVAVLDSKNQLLSEDADIEPGVTLKAKQLEIQLFIENTLRTKVENALERLVGRDNYLVEVNVRPDWTEKSTKQTHIDSTNPAVISEKTYAEENTVPTTSGPPGVEANVQDTGIGATGGVSGTNIEETITNYQYPWFETLVKDPIGEVKEISVAIALDFVEDEQNNKVPRTPEQIDKLTRLLRTMVTLPEVQVPGDVHKFTLIEYPFDDTEARMMARAELWQNVSALSRSVLPVIFFLIVAYLAYYLFQRAFAPSEREEGVQEEIPIEPVSEAKELSLSQLGLSEFGDIASLPAEEQRRLKMQEHVIHYAAEKPDEVAAIIKAWLSA